VLFQLAVDCGLLTDLRVVDKLFTKLATIEDGFGYDIEGGYDGPPMPGFSLHPETAVLAGVSVSGDPSWARYVPLRFRGGQGVDEVEFARLLAVLLGSGKGIAHNAKFELTHLARFLRERLSSAELAEAGLDIDGYFPLFSDSMIEAYLLGTYRALGLKYLSEEVFGYHQTEIWDLFPPMTEKQKKCIRFTDLELTPKVITYACDDAAWCLALSRKNRPKVKDKLLYRVEMGIVPILAHMEDHGVQFDWTSMERVKTEAEQFATLMRQEIMKRLSEMTGKCVDINLNSSAQVADVLYTQLGMSTTRLTKGSGKMSTDEKALSGLAKKHAVVKRLLEYREVKKLIGSYLEKFPRDFRYAKDGRTHPSHRQTSIVSGRFAVSDPPYQQLPKKYYYQLESGLEFFLKFRDFVMAAPDHYLIGFDYSQIELRVLAGLSGEPALVRAFEEGIDVHVMTASLMFGVPLEEVTEDQRGIAKTQNFAILYGQGAKGIAERLGISVEESKAFMEKYFAIYSSVQAWIDKQTRTGIQAGYTISKFGRIHPLWQLESDSSAIRGTGERLCVNAPTQGGAADLMKIAMVRADRKLRSVGLHEKVHLQMNIHDALVWEAHRSVSPQRIIDLVNPEVCIPVPGWPVIKADWEVGTRWGSMVKLKLDANNKIIVPKRAPAKEPELAMAG
jgi:DNA polymerase-1